MSPRKPRAVPRVYTFVVHGDDHFPIDMLRYDLCYPKSSADAATIERTFKDRRGDYHVTLASSKHPTEERWGSYGWAVESVE